MVSQWEVYSGMQLAHTAGEAKVLWLLHKRADAGAALLAGAEQRQVQVHQIWSWLGQLSQAKGISLIVAS